MTCGPLNRFIVTATRNMGDPRRRNPGAPHPLMKEDAQLLRHSFSSQTRCSLFCFVISRRNDDSDNIKFCNHSHHHHISYAALYRFPNNVFDVLVVSLFITFLTASDIRKLHIAFLIYFARWKIITHIRAMGISWHRLAADACDII